MRPSDFQAFIAAEGYQAGPNFKLFRQRQPINFAYNALVGPAAFGLGSGSPRLGASFVPRLWCK